MGPSTASDDAGSRGAGSANRSAWQRVGRAVREPGRAAGYVQRPVAQAMSPRALYLDPHHDLRRSVFVAGSRRSGSTLLAEVLTAGNRLRLMFEPMRRDRVPLSRNVPEGVFVPPDDDAAALAHVVTRVLTGRLRSSWADRYNTCRLARGPGGEGGAAEQPAAVDGPPLPRGPDRLPAPPPVGHRLVVLRAADAHQTRGVHVTTPS
jgi:hypothetical protein